MTLTDRLTSCRALPKAQPLQSFATRHRRGFAVRLEDGQAQRLVSDLPPSWAQWAKVESALRLPAAYVILLCDGGWTEFLLPVHGRADRAAFGCSWQLLGLTHRDVASLPKRRLPLLISSSEKSLDEAPRLQFFGAQTHPISESLSQASPSHTEPEAESARQWPSATVQIII